MQIIPLDDNLHEMAMLFSKKNVTNLPSVEFAGESDKDSQIPKCMLL